MGGSQPGEPARAEPAAEEQRHHHRRGEDHGQVLAHHDQAELHARVLGVEPGGELVLRLGQVERQTVRFGDAGDEEHQQAEHLGYAEPDVFLGLHDGAEVE